jgi:hypothetical protein
MRIAYICLSDLHLGEEDSLLTNIERVGNTWMVDAYKSSPVMDGLLDLLTEVKNKVNDGLPIGCFVLNGDIFELALSKFRDVVAVFKLFLSDIAERDLFEKLLYIPGNHDHHFWEQARERSFADSLSLGDELPEYFHTLSLDAPNIKSYLLDTIAKVCGTNIPIEVRYPLLNLPFKKSKRNFFIHHGHLHEEIYLLMSRALNLLFERHPVPNCLEELEKENFAWIDFLWSTLGRSGKVGENIEYIYESLSRKESLNTLIEQVAGRLAEEWEFLPDILPKEEWLERKGLEKLLQHLVNFVLSERQDTEIVLSEDARDRLEWFIDEVLPNYLGVAYVDEHRDWQTTYVFGHTHKPINKGNLDSVNFRSIQLFNTGGWVVEPGDKPSRIHGAAMTVIGENGEVGHAHLFSQAEDYQGPEFPRIFGDYQAKQILSDAFEGEVADEFIRRVRRAIAIRWRKPPR